MCRLLVRLAAPLCLGATLVTCSEAPTTVAPGTFARIAVVPNFSREAAAIFRSLSEFALAIDNVHIVVRGAPAVGEGEGPLLKDTTVSFPADAQEVRIQLSLPLSRREQPVIVHAELREGTATLFEGTQDVIARQGETTGNAEPISLTYVGPGADAEFITLNLEQAVLMPSGKVQLSATAYTHLEKVTDLPIAWSSSDASIAAVSATGLVTSTGKTGVTTITARGLNGISKESTLTVAAPVSLLVSTGDAQVGIVTSALAKPFVVTAVTADGKPVIDAPITFSAVTSGAAVSPTAARTDLSGNASTTMTLGTASGSYAFRAELAGQPNVSSSVGATATADVATQLLILQQPATAAQATIAFKQQPKVQLADRFGNPVRLTGVVISAVAQSVCGLRCAVGAASIQPPTVVMRAVISADTITRGLVGTTSVTTDGEGVATFTDLALNELVGDWLLVFMDRNESLASATSSFIALGAGPPRSIVKASADTSSVLPGAVISPLARVIDAVGNGVENVTVSWDNKQGTQGTLDNTVTRTDASGFTGPGQWTVPLTQTLGLTYTIVASTPGLNLENSLAFYAIITQLLP